MNMTCFDILTEGYTRINAAYLTGCYSWARENEPELLQVAEDLEYGLGQLCLRNEPGLLKEEFETFESIWQQLNDLFKLSRDDIL